MRPVVTYTTERLYARLPECYRSADEATDWQLLAYVSSIVDQLGTLEGLYYRLAYVHPDDGGAPGDTSDLVDPAAADAAWLGWLAQLVGVALVPGLSEAAQRDSIAGAASGYRAGTKAAIAAAAASALTGTRHVEIFTHAGGDQWKVEVRTRTSETPSVPAVLAAILAAQAKPAGVEIVTSAYQITWAVFTAAYPTWAAVNGKTWAQIAATGAP